MTISVPDGDNAILFLKLCAACGLGLVGGAVFDDTDLFTSCDVQDTDESSPGAVDAAATRVDCDFFNAGNTVELLGAALDNALLSIAGAGVMFRYHTIPKTNFEHSKFQTTAQHKSRERYIDINKTDWLSVNLSPKYIAVFL